MSWREKKSEKLATGLGAAAGMLVMTPMMISLFFDSLSMGTAFLIGIVLALPLMILSLILMPGFKPESEPKPFLPRNRDWIEFCWNALFYASLLGFILVIPSIFSVVAYLFFPSGDGWGVVTIRIVSFSIAAAVGYLLWMNLHSILRWMFEGKVSEEQLREVEPKQAEATPRVAMSPIAAAWKHWRTGVIAIFAFAIALGVIDLKNRGAGLNGVPRRARGIVQIIQWCRGNPNTVRSSALAVGIAAAGWYGFQIRRDSREKWEGGEGGE